jgi:hypothetical protein
MYNSSPIQACMNAGKEAFKSGSSRKVSRNYACMDIATFAFLKGFDEMAIIASRKK